MRRGIGVPSGVDIVFADMDGTFLDANKEVPASNFHALDKLEQLGIPFVPCTGRPVSAVDDRVMAHPATRYVVASNGSVVFDVRMEERICVRGMRSEVVLDLFERVRSLPTTFDVFADGEVYAPRDRYEAMGSYGIDAPMLEMLLRVRRPVDMDVPQIVARATSLEKVTCFWGTEEARKGIENAAAAIGDLSVAQGHPKDFEFQAAGVSKGSALTWLCDRLGVSADRSLAFGDEGNDVSLLEAAGWGVAMANATDQVLSVADDVAPTNDSGGVGEYLLDLLCQA